MGPNVKRLAILKMSRDAIPPGGSIADGVRFLSDKKGMVESLRKSESWALAAVEAVRQGGDPNPWRNSDDEAIAGELLRRIEARKRNAAQLGMR